MGYLKVIKSGHIYEIYEYEYEPKKAALTLVEKSNLAHWFEVDRDKNTEEILEIKKELQKEKNKTFRAMRARNMIRRLACSNFDNTSKFVTLTFGQHVTDLNIAHEHFKKFILRLKYYLKNEKEHQDLKYICVVEFMKNGRVHYHLIMNVPYVKNAKITEIWKGSNNLGGHIKINRIKHVDNIGAYMVKYMTKGGSDERLNGRKSYFTSRNNLERPSEFKGAVAKAILEALQHEKEVFSSCYPTEYLGQCNYTEYNLLRE